MSTLRELFHSLANILNKISIASGVTRDLLESECLFNLTKDKLKERNQQLIQLLKNIENNVVDADQILTNIKNIVYNLVDPDRKF